MDFDLSTLKRDYGDIYGEASACRTSAALFDFSFMSRARIRGSAAFAAVQKLTPRRLDDLAVGRLRYCLRLSPEGHAVADLTVWRVTGDEFEVMSGRHRDIADLTAAAPRGTAADLSGECVIYAVQGPDSLDVLHRCGAPGTVAQLPYFGCSQLAVAGIPCLVGRLGYTGEAGFEIIAPREHAEALWQTLAQWARPAGFAAADILRIEAGFILFANELALPVTPVELGLDAFAIRSAAREYDELKLVAFTAGTASKPVLWQRSASAPQPCPPGGIIITSACWSPIADATLGLGFVLQSGADSKAALHDPHGEFHDIRLVGRPFFDPEKRRPRAPWR